MCFEVSVCKGYLQQMTVSSPPMWKVPAGSSYLKKVPPKTYIHYSVCYVLNTFPSNSLFLWQYILLVRNKYECYAVEWIQRRRKTHFDGNVRHQKYSSHSVHINGYICICGGTISCGWNTSCCWSCSQKYKSLYSASSHGWRADGDLLQVTHQLETSTSCSPHHKTWTITLRCEKCLVLQCAVVGSSSMYFLSYIKCW